MADWGLLLLLLVAIAIGFYIGRRGQGSASEVSYSTLQPHYIQGLNYLLNERQDAAIDTFIDALDVNSETLETHLALGNLLRKRGEVDRAIKIHQNLLSRPGLGETQSEQVQLELARDFIKAGLFDRAELLLEELSETSHQQTTRQQCLEHLIEIYRDEKEWLKGIGAINQISGRRFSRMKDDWRQIQSHFYCELAEEAIDRNDYLTARRHLKTAMTVDKHSARSSLLLGRLEDRLSQYREALRAFRQVYDQDPEFLPEVLPHLQRCYQKLGQELQFKAYLHDIMHEHDSLTCALYMADLICADEGELAAVKYLTDQPACAGSLVAARKILGYQMASQERPVSGVVMLESVLTKVEQGQPLYRCRQCGFSGQLLHWLCPGCKTWGSVKPIE